MRADKVKGLVEDCISGLERVDHHQVSEEIWRVEAIGSKELVLCFDEVRKDIEKDLCIHDYSEYVSFKESLWKALSSRIEDVLKVKGE